MSETFENILVKDDRLGCITPKVNSQVFKGGQNVTCQPYRAISETTANHTYNVTVPSLETIINREVLWQSTVTLRISNPNKGANYFDINYGVTDALAPFPLHNLASVMSCTINNNTVNLNVQESLPILLRMVDPEEFSKYDSMTPTALDFVANYVDAVKRQEFQIDATAAGAAAPRPIVYY
ncbi:MAG: phage major capsid domain-containing protein, partial [Candidatus Fonsibacter sp.]